MLGDPQVVAHLNAQLKNELTAINQYFLHYRLRHHWGYARLARSEYERSILEMKHADTLMERILMLDRLPNPRALAQLRVGGDPVAALQGDLALERASQETLKEGILHCEAVRDCVSREVLRQILEDCDEHVDFLETQLDLIGQAGLQNYLQSQTGGDCAPPA